MTSHQTKAMQGEILIVDDTPVNLRLLSQILIERGYEVRAVLSGPRALASVAMSLPDLVLLDVMMPEMDGYEVCRRLKAGAETRDIPIIFISALESTEDKVKAFEAGGVDYVTKPIRVAEVIARVETHLALRRANVAVEKRLHELACANAELKARNEELDAFAHTVAHDIKSPLNNILGYSYLLQQNYEDVPDEDRDEWLDALVRSSQKIDTIVDALLLLARVRKKEVQFEPLDMGRIVAETQTRLAEMIDKYQADIRLPVSWPVAQGYGPWVEEVWVNYLSNSIKYGGRPPLVELGGEAEEDGMVRFWVRDNGPGISPEEKNRLFTPFERLNHIRVDGHGLGLSIVRRIVENFDGQVGVESAEGDGSVFSFTLPRAE